MSSPIIIERGDWPALAAAFHGFFDELGGAVEEADGEIAFDAGFTGLAISRDGSSRSFMPLHDLSATWESIEFDESSHEVTLTGGTATYTYRVPPQLLP